jgi:hypothetical protein
VPAGFEMENLHAGMIDDPAAPLARGCASADRG